jgi:preprotein translocase subunit YajC
MNWIMILVPSLVVVAAIFVIVYIYSRRNPAKQEENIEMMQNVEKSLKEGKISEEDAQVIKKSIGM